MTSLTQPCSLTLHQVALDVFLGWPDEECETKQTVHVDIQITFPKVPHACVSDNLADTFSYDLLIQHLIQETANARYRLLEHLGHEIYQLVKKLVANHTKLSVSVRKYPSIPALTGGASFSIGD